MSDGTDHPLSEIEKTLEKAEAKLHENGDNKNSIGMERHMVYEDLLTKEIKLQKENQTLNQSSFPSQGG